MYLAVLCVFAANLNEAPCCQNDENVSWTGVKLEFFHVFCSMFFSLCLRTKSTTNSSHWNSKQCHGFRKLWKKENNNALHLSCISNCGLQRLQPFLSLWSKREKQNWAKNGRCILSKKLPFTCLVVLQDALKIYLHPQDICEHSVLIVTDMKTSMYREEIKNLKTRKSWCKQCPQRNIISAVCNLVKTDSNFNTYTSGLLL